MKTGVATLIWPIMPISQSFFRLLTFVVWQMLTFETLQYLSFLLYFPNILQNLSVIVIRNKIIRTIWIPHLYLFSNWYEPVSYLTKDALEMHRLNLMSCKTKINMCRFCFCVYKCHVWLNSFVAQMIFTLLLYLFFMS